MQPSSAESSAPPPAFPIRLSGLSEGSRREAERWEWPGEVRAAASTASDRWAEARPRVRPEAAHRGWNTACTWEGEEGREVVGGAWWIHSGTTQRGWKQSDAPVCLGRGEET